MVHALTVLYLICGALLTVYTAGGLILTAIYLLKLGKPSTPPAPLIDYPTITIQLPIYNERYVVERLLDAISKMDYPVTRLTIQLLDDSTDDTSRIAARKILQLRQQGFNVQHIRRTNRTGYKAGALAYGMTQSETEFYAIFDADFVPPPDFLTRVMPHFVDNPALGLVQGRWGHLNSDENALTAAQTLAIDAHFVIEQSARSEAGLLLSFNGTGGIWRADCIHDTGGWQDTTLTEDFDLSYRAQLRGWRLMTLRDLIVPGELPSQIAAFRQQQARWAKGSTQCLLRTIRPLWTLTGIPLAARVMATLHLCQYIPYPILVGLTLLTPILALSGVLNEIPVGFLTFSGIVPPLMYVISQVTTEQQWARRLLAFPALIIYGTGIALSNTMSVFSVLVGLTDEFRRTPKHGTQTDTAAYTVNDGWMSLAEAGMALYAIWGVVVTWQHFPAATPYLVLSAASYGVVSLTAMRDQFRLRRLHGQTDRVSSVGGSGD